MITARFNGTIDNNTAIGYQACSGGQFGTGPHADGGQDNIGKGWRELMAVKLTPTAFRDSIMLARKWTAEQAVEYKLVDAYIVSDTCDDFSKKACQLDIVKEAVECSWNRRNLSRLKYDIYHVVSDALATHTNEPLTRMSKF